jgi:hypothetical protein
MVEFIKERLSFENSAVAFSLSTILIKPVQRIFKYPLFLNRLIEVNLKKIKFLISVNILSVLFKDF